MTKIIVLIVIWIVIPLSISATIINVPDDYSTIQEAIDTSSYGDTVLVQPGIYYESVEFNMHNIVLASLFLTTNETSFISSTIIDGSSTNRCIEIYNFVDSTAKVVGFTLQNGYSGSGGGIAIGNANPVISNNIIKDNIGYVQGGGISASYSKVRIENNIIYNNRTNTLLSENIGQGGGIAIYDSSAVLKSNIIFDNKAKWGGGIYIGISYPYTPEIVLNNNIIVQNEATLNGGGIYFSGSNDQYLFITNSVIFANIAPNNSELAGSAYNSDINYCLISGGWDSGVGNIDVDPLFRDTANGDFHLMSIACGDPYDSPCIDAGDSLILDSALACGFGLGGERSDLGAYGGGFGGYMCGDATENGVVNLLDITALILYLYQDGYQPIPLDAGDANCDGSVNILDVTYLINYLYLGGPDPCCPL